MEHEGEDPTLVREPMLEGLWYPADKEELLDAIHACLATIDTKEACHGLLVPFGPLVQCSAVLGPAFSWIRGQSWDRVILIGPGASPRRNQLFLPESVRFVSPLGSSPLDQEAFNVILDSSMLVERNDVPHLNSNSLELSLAFVHFFLPGIPVVPLLCGESSEAMFRTVLAAVRLLETELKGPTLFVFNASLRRYAGRQTMASSVWQRVMAGDSAGIFELCRSEELDAESLIILALVATFVAKHGQRQAWSPDERGLAGLVF